MTIIRHRHKLLLPLILVATAPPRQSPPPPPPPPSRPPVPVAAAAPIVAPVAEPGAFRDRRGDDRKRARIMATATVRAVVPGMDRDDIYRLFGTPQFAEAITRRYDYLFELTGGDQPPMRCRMRVVFGRLPPTATAGGRVGVTRIVWQTQACADRSVAE